MFTRLLASMTCILGGSVAVYMSLVTAIHYGTLAAHVQIIKVLPPLIRSQPLEAERGMMILGVFGMAFGICSLTAGITLLVKAFNCEEPKEI